MYSMLLTKSTTFLIGPIATLLGYLMNGIFWLLNKIGLPNIGVGEGTVIECALIDKNARIGRNVHIRHLQGRPDSECEHWVARDGLVIIPKSAVIPDGMVI